MSTVSPTGDSYNPEDVQPARFIGHPDELSPAIQAEMNSHFGYDRQPDERDIDAMYEARMQTLDLVAARTAAMIELSVGVAGKNKFEARVRCGTKWHKLGRFTNENLAVEACHRRAAALRAGLGLTV